jgi:hypothetical protein
MITISVMWGKNKNSTCLGMVYTTYTNDLGDWLLYVIILLPTLGY